MTGDRYLKGILTIIALELLWLGVSHGTPAASAQGAVTPVIIRGIQLDGPSTTGFLPVGIVGTYRQIPGVASATLEPPRIRIDGPVAIESARPIKIEADSPIRVESVPYTPSVRPGE
jgi:hypothetical protein